MDFTDLEKRILAVPDREQGSGASLEEIRDAERTLGIRFVGGFRTFLERFGWLVVGPFEIYGIGADVSKRVDLVETTLSERSEMHPHLRHDLIPIMNDGAGNLYCLDTTNSVDSEVPIVFWCHELSSNQRPERISQSFEAWLETVLRDL